MIASLLRQGDLVAKKVDLNFRVGVGEFELTVTGLHFLTVLVAAVQFWAPICVISLEEPEFEKGEELYQHCFTQLWNEDNLELKVVSRELDLYSHIPTQI